MDCPKKMWSPSGACTKMDEFRKVVNEELQLTLGTCTVVTVINCVMHFLTLLGWSDYVNDIHSSRVVSLF